MSRVVQKTGLRGSLKWIQQAVNEHPGVLNAAIGLGEVEWLSPLGSDQYAEYRDGSFLERCGAKHLSSDLEAFWPQRGPQWDALGRGPKGEIVLVEAKAHLDEICSPGSAAGVISRAVIGRTLDKVSGELGAAPRAPWIQTFYQLANRLAHLHFLRSRDLDARLVLVNFIGDADMRGPSTAAEWEAAYRIVWNVMGLTSRHKLSAYMTHAYPDVRDFRVLRTSDRRPGRPDAESS